MDQNKLSVIGDEKKVKEAHEYLKRFLEKFDLASRGGIHDFIEVLLANMVGQAVNEIEQYLSNVYKSINANELMFIVCDSFIKKIDSTRKNLDNIKQVGFTRF